MNRITRSLLSTALLAFAVLPACTDSGTGSSSQASTSGRASIQVVVTGDTSTSLSLVATAEGSADVALDEHFTIAADGSVAATVELPEGDYSFTLTALAEDGVTITATGAVDVAIAAEATINLSATLDAEAGGGLETEVNTPPAIGDIAVNVIGNLQLGLDRLGDATLTASVTDADGDVVTYFWSGVGIEGSLAGNASLAIDNDAMVQARLEGALNLDLGAQFYVVAQDEHGGAAVAEVTIGSNATCLLCGAVNVEVVAGGDVGIEDVGEQLEACLSAHVSCSASCDVLAHADNGGAEASVACRADCGAELADCASEL